MLRISKQKSCVEFSANLDVDSETRFFVQSLIFNALISNSSVRTKTFLQISSKKHEIQKKTCYLWSLFFLMLNVFFHPCWYDWLFFLGNAEDNLIYLYDRNGRHKWKFPVRENTSFKRLKQINFDLAGNLITVDNYYQQVQVISRQGKLIRVLHGRSLQFARPICAIPRGDNQIVVMSEFGSVVIIEKYL